MKSLNYRLVGVLPAAMIVFLTSAPTPTWAQGNSGTAVLHNPTVVQASRHGITPRLGDIAPNPALSSPHQGPPREIPRPQVPAAPQGQTPSRNDPVIQSSPGPLAPTTLKTFEGGSTDVFIPADANGAAGGPYIDKNGIAQAGQYVQWVNARFTVFDKGTSNTLY